MDNKRRPELLSPVGSPQALIAAVENGADAVYLGGKNFSARQYASNFDDQQLEWAIHYCHLQGVKVYVTINILLKEEELQDIFDYIVFLYEVGVDALIIQDLGLLKIVQSLLPNFPIQSSTQMTIHTIEGVRLLEREGFYRAVLARELSLKEIKDIVAESNIEIKIFNHGALCISYSGQCLMSSIIGGRSGNRGRCAQPCRKQYTLVDMKCKDSKDYKKKGFLLSPKDLSTLEQVDLLINSGAHSFKIEGRMKKPEYVAVVTALYKKAIHQYYHTGKVDVSEKDKKELMQIFNRGFTTAYLFSHPGENIVSMEKPNNRGIYLGNIISINRKLKTMEVLLVEPLRKGDGIEVWTKTGQNPGIMVSTIVKNKKTVLEAESGEKVSLPLLKNVKVGDGIYKTSDTALLKKAQDSFEKLYKNKRKIGGAISIRKGEPLHLYLWDQENHHISIQGDVLVEKAIHKPLEEKRVVEQLSKLGGTPFILEGMEVNMDEDGTIPLKEINKIRRIGIELLEREIVKQNRKIDTKEIRKKFNSLWQPIENNRDKECMPKLSAKVKDINGVKALLQTHVSEIIFGGDIEFDLEEYKEALHLARENNKAIVFAFPRICRQDYISKLRKYKRDLIKLSPDGLLVSNLELVHFFQNVSIRKEGDFTLNAFNHLAFDKLSQLGLQEICISPELTLKEIEKIKQYTNVPLSFYLHGHIEMMISEYCPISCDKGRKSCHSCTNRVNYGLKDEKGMVFPIYIDDFGRSHILNSQKLCLLESLKAITKVGLEKIRLQFLLENEQQIIETVEAYHHYMENIQRGIVTMPHNTKKFLEKTKKQGYTKGHYFRGVL